MNKTTLVELLEGLSKAGVTIWLDGGWGVDALLDEQRRPHADVDLVLQQQDLSLVVALLRSRGYEDLPRPDTRPWNFVVGDRAGNEVDIHVITLDERGNGIYGPVENGQTYPAQSLTGIGWIGHHRVRCVTPEYQIANRAGYAPREKGVHDVRRLAERFAIPLPKQSEGE